MFTYLESIKKFFNDCYYGQQDLNNKPFVINNSADLKNLYNQITNFNILVHANQDIIQQKVDLLEDFRKNNDGYDELINKIQKLWNEKLDTNKYRWVDPNSILDE